MADPVTEPATNHKHERETDTVDSDDEFKPGTAGVEIGANWRLVPIASSATLTIEKSNCGKN